jgi:uncharacterized protein YjbI with pentapeptide repeats
MKFEVMNRYSGAVQCTAEIKCEEDAPVSIKLGLAVRWAIKHTANLARADLAGADLAGADLGGANLAGADLAGANLAGADLAGADLAGADLARANLARANLARADLAGANLARANLAGANVIDGGLRSDGYRFLAVRDGETILVRAGCRTLSFEKAREWWSRTRGGTRLGDESLALVDHLERMARIAGWL